MTNQLVKLSRMTYPGRVIVIGKSPAGADVVLYSITGRSPSSQSRKFVRDETGGTVLVRPTDEETLKTGNPELLIYPCIMVAPNNDGIAVSNGKQTGDILPAVRSGESPTATLDRSLRGWCYEPDEPNFTPRISGCVTNGAALSILKRADSGQVVRNCFELPQEEGIGWMIATYSGENVNPLPSFEGEPLKVGLDFDTAEGAARAMYEAQAPEGGDDFRVATAAVFRDRAGNVTVAITNRHDGA